MNKTFVQGATTINAKDRMEYLSLIQTHREQGYDFIVLNDARKLRYGQLGIAGAGEPLVWLTLPMWIHHSEDLDTEAPERPEDGTTPRAKERFVSVVEYYHEYHRHEGQGCGIVDLTDTLSVRPAFLCRTCEVIVRADHDECIDLARTLGEAPSNAGSRA